MVLLDIGAGWSPAILNSEKELEFIVAREIQLLDWVGDLIAVGGSSNSSSPLLSAHQYFVNDTGEMIKIYVTCFISGLHKNYSQK